MNPQIQISVKGNREGKITVNIIVILIRYLMTNLLHRNDKFVTVHNKFLKIPTLTTAHFANRVRRLRIV